MSIVQLTSAPAAAPWIMTLAAPGAVLAAAAITVIVGLYQVRKTHHVNTITAYRLKWLDLFREQLPELLALGEEAYAPGGPALSAAKAAERRHELRLAAKRLLVLLGRESEPRKGCAALVRAFADAPCADLADRLEAKAQEVFRERMDQIYKDAGVRRSGRGRS